MPALPPLTVLSDDDEPKGCGPSMPSAWAPVKELSDDESNSHREDFRELGLRPKRKRKKGMAPPFGNVWPAKFTAEHC